MPTTNAWAFHTREHQRHRVESAHLEFDYPTPGRRMQMPVWDVSRGGVCFSVRGDLTLLVRNTSLSSVVISFEDCEVSGDLVVSHITEEAPFITRCGARFDSMDEANRNKLDELISRLESDRPS